MGYRWLIVATLFVLAAGCKDDADTQAPRPDVGAQANNAIGEDASFADGAVGEPDCLSTRDFFSREVWGPLMSTTCTGCHQLGGAAFEQNSRLTLLPSNYPGFLDTNIENLREAMKVQFGGVSQLLLKPTGRVAHGGGEVLSIDSAEYAALEEFVRRIESNEEETCPDTSSHDAFDDLTMLSPTQTLRKAALHLVGRLPTTNEYAAVEAGGEAALKTTLTAMMGEDAFYDRLSTLWNDIFLTDRYLSYRGHATGVLYREDFPRTQEWFAGLDDATKDRVNFAVAREPLELINYIVRNDRPFTEIITADYTVFNPFSANLYEVPLQFTNAQDAGEWRAAKIGVTRDGSRVDFPHAGVLSSPMVLSRFPTTPTNRNRARARFVFKTFLATDILRVAERPIDPTASTAFLNPTRDDSACNVCHYMIDPIAGAFQKFDDNSQTRYRPERQWYTDMFAPGFGKEAMTVSDFDDALQWLGQRIVADSRFALSIVHIMHEGLTGRAPLIHPEDRAAAGYDARRNAWEAQDAYFREVADAFVGADYNLKVAAVAIIAGPYFRADGVQATPSAARLIELGEVATARLSSPELLARKISALVGVRWDRSWDKRELLETDYSILFGGINSDTVIDRLKAPNGVVANVVWRMANEVSCKATGYDFTHTKAKRVLFPHVELTDMPFAVSGDEVPAAAARIRENIRYLHLHLLGEELALDDPAIERAYVLFVETWQEGKQGVADGTQPDWLFWACRAEKNLETDQPLPEANQVRRDPDYVVRSWMAVLTYLLADYRFLYE
ncbi:MAG: DUF1588 domain-containing protein [Bradymonadaceae bacterium]|nr:DUF1588 domain-containing protein [Lujinxingiaceae bacterium]